MPFVPRSDRHAFAPQFYRFILHCGTFPNASFGLNNPVNIALTGLLHNHPVRMVKPNSAAGLKIVHSELGPRLSLLCGA